MNAVERLLYDEMTGFVDRLAGALPPGAGAPRAMSPLLRARLEEAEAALAAARASLVEEYGRWQQALDDAENLWALAAWHSAAAEQPGEEARALAA